MTHTNLLPNTSLFGSHIGADVPIHGCVSRLVEPGRLATTTWTSLNGTPGTRLMPSTDDQDRPASATARDQVHKSCAHQPAPLRCVRQRGDSPAAPTIGPQPHADQVHRESAVNNNDGPSDDTARAASPRGAASTDAAARKRANPADQRRRVGGHPTGLRRSSPGPHRALGHATDLVAVLAAALAVTPDRVLRGDLTVLAVRSTSNGWRDFQPHPWLPLASAKESAGPRQPAKSMALSPHSLRTRLGPSTRALVRVLLPAARAVAVSFIEYISHATLVGI